ncbi:MULTISPECIES: response regulator [unclassified Leptolyngbya]|uniref:response regulator n=1 Tax=unclassified Leptolyngbya TaxID=2650499 RepID=UPI0016876149|nr:MULTISPECIES: response regulator [unclassified Leptolyngbya]MBD1909158.1 response regulator [Leptolyngbya sp. FACHB-8]MBD2158462.1 response regulator [Leptolyngbya sp. FACHB-16]
MYNSTSLRKGLRVLVVDGNADSSELLTVLLEGYGVEAIAATCASDCLEIMQKSCPDLLISELVLPGEDGYSLMSKVKALETERGTPIPAIALTVCANKSERDQALAAGFCRHLSKPFNIDELLETVACLTRQTQELAMSPY